MVQSQHTETGSNSGHSVDEQKVSLSETFGGRSVIREILETILLTVIIVLVVKTVTGQFEVRGSSMEPSLHDGQYLIIGKLAYWFQAPARGEVIIFHPPTHPYEDYIKRVVGLPGETVEIRSGQIYIDGAQLQEPYITNLGGYSGEWVLEDKDYFVLGDNRRNSSDSHTWGVLPSDNIVGKSWVCYWPPEHWGLTQHHDFAPPEPSAE